MLDYCLATQAGNLWPASTCGLQRAVLIRVCWVQTSATHMLPYNSSVLVICSLGAHPIVPINARPRHWATQKIRIVRIVLTFVSTLTSFGGRKPLARRVNIRHLIPGGHYLSPPGDELRAALLRNACRVVLVQDAILHHGQNAPYE
jgi:hypothetical protein